MKNKLIFLGTGASLGVPLLGCPCEVCQSKDPKNKRTRPSVLIKTEGKTFVIDTGPDFRQQALRHHIYDVDGILYTHAHNDHTCGIDELRAIHYRRQKSIPVLLSNETAEDISSRYYYFFQTKMEPQKRIMDFQLLPAKAGTVEFAGMKIQYMSYKQCGMLVQGYRFGTLAYLSDIRDYEESIFSHLVGVKTLIISALRFTHSNMHLTVDEAVDFSKKINAEHTYITHISHDLEHEKTNSYLPENVKLAYDGQEIDFG